MNNKNFNIINIFISLFVITGFFFISCDAPRENPFDPDASNYNPVIEDSTVTTVKILPLGSSQTGIAEAEVILLTTAQYAETDANGNAKFVHDFEDSLKIVCRKAGYFSDTLTFNNLTKINNLQVRINAEPQINALDFYSIYLNNENIDDFISVEIYTQITDADGSSDISAAYIQNTVYNYQDTLEIANSSTSSYSNSFYLKQLSQDINPLELPELFFNLIVKNSNGDSILVEDLNILRVISESPQLNAPSGTISGADSVLFAWDAIELEYVFHYNILLYYAEATEFIYYNNIDSNETDYIITGLDAGNYYGYLEIEDNFGNICRSPHKLFTYQP